MGCNSVKISLLKHQPFCLTKVVGGGGGGGGGGSMVQIYKYKSYVQYIVRSQTGTCNRIFH